MGSGVTQISVTPVQFSFTMKINIKETRYSLFTFQGAKIAVYKDEKETKRRG